MRLLLLVLLSLPAWALQVQEMTLVSPITGQKFDVTGVPAEQDTTAVDLADMGADDDGCRHTSGPNEYDYYVAVCPFSYFAALSAEWETRSGRFREELPPELKDWVIKQFNSDWQLDHSKAYTISSQTLRMSGQPVPERKDFVMNQASIPLEKKYRYALQCYDRRAARAVVLGKIALTGAWAIRARLNVPLGNQAIDGGYEEVNALVSRQVKPGEPFSLTKWLPIYREIFAKGKGLTNEGYLVAGMTYFGLVLRDGDLAEAKRVLKDMGDRFDVADQKQSIEFLRGMVRERKRMLNEYQFMLGTATTQFMRAIAGEEFPRSRLPANLMAVAECLRRANDEPRALARAADWYLALARMPETQPKLREDIRAQGKAPGPESPFHVQLGWLADKQLARLAAAGVPIPTEQAGVDKKLLTAIVFERFGSSEYVNPEWKPRADGTPQDSALVLNLVGQAVMDSTFRSGAWPKTLDELWEQDVIKDRNRVNRFHDPATGAKLLYKALPGDVGNASPRTVVVATSRPVATGQGPRYGAYLANNQLLWSEEPLVPGAVAR